MKILHTSDWHLGKRLNGKSRLLEQQAVLNELVELCDRQQIDVVLLAGDVFDTFVPPSEAEELFFEAAVKLGRDRVMVVIAGNHDDEERLAAPKSIAKACNIVIGTWDNYDLHKDNIKGGRGVVSIRVGGEVLNVGVLPYPSEVRLDKAKAKLRQSWQSIDENIVQEPLKEESLEKKPTTANDLNSTEKLNDNSLGDQKQKPTYSDEVKARLESIASEFKVGELNIILSHLFMSGGIITDERTLGTAHILPLDILPNCQYVALGHVHKPMTLHKERNIVYSGSILQYQFDDTTAKSFVVIETKDNHIIDIRRHNIASGRRLKRIEVASVLEGEEALKSNAEFWVELRYKSKEALKHSEAARLKSYENLSEIVVERIDQDKQKTERVKRTDKELFETFFLKQKGLPPTDELTQMFLSLIGDKE